MKEKSIVKHIHSNRHENDTLIYLLFVMKWLPCAVSLLGMLCRHHNYTREVIGAPIQCQNGLHMALLRDIFVRNYRRRRPEGYRSPKQVSPTAQ